VRVLVVEDETVLREQLCEHLGSLGFVVESAADGEEALYLGAEFEFDLGVVDLGLPKVSGIEVIKGLRARDVGFPILILTARDHWQDKVAGLEAGADDYLVKPFHMEELVARLNALVRRSAGFADPVLSFGRLVVNVSSKEVFLDEKPISLSRFEFNTLEFLIFNAGKVVSKSELTEHLYQQDFDRDSNVIEVFVRRLRKKLDPDGSLKPILTVRGQGYRFVLEQGGSS